MRVNPDEHANYCHICDRPTNRLSGLCLGCEQLADDDGLAGDIIEEGVVLARLFDKIKAATLTQRSA